MWRKLDTTMSVGMLPSSSTAWWMRSSVWYSADALICTHGSSSSGSSIGIVRICTASSFVSSGGLLGIAGRYIVGISAVSRGCALLRSCSSLMPFSTSALLMLVALLSCSVSLVHSFTQLFGPRSCKSRVVLLFALASLAWWDSPLLRCAYILNCEHVTVAAQKAPFF